MSEWTRNWNTNTWSMESLLELSEKTTEIGPQVARTKSKYWNEITWA